MSSERDEDKGMTTSSAGTSAESSPRTSGFLSKVAAVLVMLIGVGLVATTLISNLFAVGPAFENLISDFRPALTQQSLDTARADIAGLSAVQTEFSTKLAPALSQQLQMTPEQFNGFVSEKFPAVAAGMGALPKAVPTFDGLINTLDEQRPLLVKGVDQAVERGNGLGQCAHASCDRRELLGDEPVELLRGHLELLAQGGGELGAELCLHRRKARDVSTRGVEGLLCQCGAEVADQVLERRADGEQVADERRRDQAHADQHDQ